MRAAGCWKTNSPCSGRPSPGGCAATLSRGERVRIASPVPVLHFARHQNSGASPRARLYTVASLVAAVASLALGLLYVFGKGDIMPG